jgi:hypothetical protein
MGLPSVCLPGPDRPGSRRVRGSGKWLIRSVDVRGQVDRAGFLRRPAVPSRARLIVGERIGFRACWGVGDQRAIKSLTGMT